MGKLIVELDYEAGDQILRSVLKDTIKRCQDDLDKGDLHPDDKKIYEKTVKKSQWLLDNWFGNEA